MERMEPTADASLAAIRERSRFGMAIAAMIKMIATTISNSIREKPFCFFKTNTSFLEYRIRGTKFAASHASLEGKFHSNCNRSVLPNLKPHKLCVFIDIRKHDLISPR